MTDRDPFELSRFVDAQSAVWSSVLAELRDGRKRSHWMWFVFPQLRGLGRSETARHYGLGGLEEARAYLAHPLLGARLQECASVLEGLDPRLSAHDIFGDPDDLKLRSCLTLFAQVAGPDSVYNRLLRRYYAGVADELTLGLLQGG
jgi:uncharacterized protein (DUF1810 family)